jgi:hypothetical protein
VCVRAWPGLHPKTRRIGERYGCERAPVVRGTVVLVELAKLPHKTRKPNKLWLWFSGEGEPDLDLLVAGLRQEVRPRAHDPLPQADAGVERAEGQAPRTDGPLELARALSLRPTKAGPLSCADDRRLPWERPQRDRRLTPCRTLRGFATLLAAVGTPAREPKPCGRSPGRPKGRLSGRAKRYPALKKAA